MKNVLLVAFPSTGCSIRSFLVSSVIWAVKSDWVHSFQDGNGSAPCFLLPVGAISYLLKPACFFRHSSLRWWGPEGLLDLQSPLDLYANCSVLLRSWKETKAGQNFCVCVFPGSVNTLETFKVRPPLKFPYPGWQILQLSPTLGAGIKNLQIQRRSLSLGSFQDQSYKTFSWMDVKSHDLIHLNCIQFISTLIYIHKLKGSWHCMWGKGAPINILLTSELLWGKRQKAKVWWMHTHWMEGLAHNSEMMHFSLYPINHLCIWKEIQFFFIYYSFVVRVNCMYPECWSNMEREGKGRLGFSVGP